MRHAHIFFAYSSLFIFGLVDNLRGPLYPEVINVFGVSNGLSSWMFTLTSLVSFLVTAFNHWWLKRLGAVAPMKVAMLFHAAALMLMGLSALAQSPAYFALFLFAGLLLGIGMGIQSVGVNLVIAKVSSPVTGAKLFSGLHSMYGAASFLSPLLMGAVFRYAISWQYFLIACALIPLVHLVIFYRLPALGITPEGKSAQTLPFGQTLMPGAIFSFYVASEILVSSRLVFYLKEVGKLKIEHASLGLTVFFVLLLAGRALFSFITPTLSRLSLLRLSAGLTLALFLLALLHHPLWLALSGASMSYFFPYGMDYVKLKFDNATSIISQVMIYVGAMIVSMHFVFGVVAETWGIMGAMWLGPLMLTVVFVLLLLSSKET